MHTLLIIFIGAMSMSVRDPFSGYGSMSLFKSWPWLEPYLCIMFVVCFIYLKFFSKDEDEIIMIIFKSLIFPIGILVMLPLIILGKIYFFFTGKNKE